MRKGEERSLNLLHRLFHFNTHINLERRPFLLSDHHQLMGGFSVAAFSVEDGK
jgi:hypothetical protein